MESAPGSRGLGPYELPESLFYLTPPPPWFARNGPGEPPPAQPEAALPAKPRLLVRLREAIRLRGYSPRTEQAYVSGCGDTSFSTGAAIRRTWDGNRSRPSCRT